MMRSAVLRASAEELDIDAILARHPKVPGSVYRRGERRSLKKTHLGSGINLFVSDSCQHDVHNAEILMFLQLHEPLLRDLRASGATMCMDTGVTMGDDPNVWGRCFHTSLDVVQRYAELGISVEFTCYYASPESDEAPAGDSLSEGIGK